MRLFVFIFVLMSSFSGFSQTTKVDQRRALNTYLAEQQVSNGGLEVKKEFFDLKVSTLRRKYTNLINQAMTLEEYHGFWPKSDRKVLPESEFEQLMIGLTAEFQDGHHNTMRKSFSHWDLGLKTAAIQGKLIITGFNDKIYTPGRFGSPLQVGDEIIALDGKSVQDLKKEFLLYTRMFSGTYEGQELMALESMVNRSGRYLRAVEEGDSVVLTIKRGKTLLEGELTWVDVSKLSQEILFYAGLNPRAPKNFTPPRYDYGMMSQRMSQFRKGIESLRLKNGAITEIGDLVNIDMAREIQKIPSHFHPRLTVAPVSRLHAYTVNVSGGLTAGVIRIPSYSPSSYLEVIREFNWLAEVIERMNNSGVAYFIVDANSNGGGYVNYVSHLMRFFAFSGDIKTGSANIRITKTYLQMLRQASVKGLEASLWNDFGDKSVEELKNIVSIEEVAQGVKSEIDLKDYYSVLKESWGDKNQLRLLHKRLQKMYEQGIRWSGQLPYMGTSNGISENSSGRASRMMNPVFEKPVIFLNDIRSASGGDYAPAILIANGKAIVMGDTSRGLGMPVYRSQNSLPGSEMYTRNPYAFSLLPNGLPLENIGPVPHIRREIFHADLMNGFAQYSADVLNAGIYITQGKKVSEVIQETNKSVFRMLSHGRNVPKEIIEFYGQVTNLHKVVSLSISRNKKEVFAQELQGVYRNFNKELLKLKNKGFSELGVFIGIPLPTFLLEEDIMLSSVFRSRSVLDRLEMLSTHSKYKKRPETRKLLEVLKTTYTTLENVSTTNDCNSLLLGLKGFKTR